MAQIFLANVLGITKPNKAITQQLFNFTVVNSRLHIAVYTLETLL